MFSITQHGHLDGQSSAYIGSNLVRDSVVPIPRVLWLFGSGLPGLVGLARTR
jgi:hypothetical protein